MKKRWLYLGVIIVYMFIMLINAQKLDIQIKNSYLPGEEINFKMILYGDNNQLINEKVNYEIQDFYTEVVKSDSANSGENVKFSLPENSIRGHWAIIAKYNDIEKKQLFNVLELEKAEIKLEGQKLIVKNIGNIPYRKPIQISIGDHEETSIVPLGIGETKEIKLTAPDGEYDVSVSDGTKENTLIFRGVSLTGNVIGLERPNESLIQKYPILTLFFIVIILAIVAISVLRIRNAKK